MAERAPCALHLKGSFEQVAVLRRLQRNPDPDARVDIERVDVVDAHDGYVFVRVTVRSLDESGDPRRALLAAVCGLEKLEANVSEEPPAPARAEPE